MSTQKAFRVVPGQGTDSITLSTSEMPQVKRKQVLVKLYAASLNFRDIAIVKGLYPPPLAENLIPVSDAAGEVVEIGEDVTYVKVGDKVCGSFMQTYVAGKAVQPLMNCLGGDIHGVLQQYRVFEETGIVKIPSFYSYEQAATLPCAAVTAWNALHCGAQKVGPEQTVLVLGTGNQITNACINSIGGVAIFALQFAKAAGARVIVVSSSDDKLAKAKQLGADDLINYSKDAAWDKQVLQLTNNKGVDHVIEIGGSATLERSLSAVRYGGQIHIIGFLAGPKDFNVAMQVLFKGAYLRGILVGSREMFEDMNASIQNNKIVPVVDQVFEFEKTKDAYEYMIAQKHVGKVVIRIQ